MVGEGGGCPVEAFAKRRMCKDAGGGGGVKPSPACFQIIFEGVVILGSKTRKTNHLPSKAYYV
jgi:hypothetical protein